MRWSVDGRGLRCWAITVMLSIAGCGDVDDVADPDSGPSPPDMSVTDPACDDTVSWDTFADGFVRNYCRGCHSSALDDHARYGAPTGVNFDGFDDVRDRVDRVRARATGDDASMPPGGGPSEDERHHFALWLDCVEIL